MKWYRIASDEFDSFDMEDIPQDQEEKSPVIFDSQNGIGQVPNNLNVDYLGFVKEMRPDEFMSLVPFSPLENADKIAELIRAGRTVAPPFLVVEWKGSYWQVLDHEGRNRVKAIKMIDPSVILPVHIFPRGMRARDITDEMRYASFASQE